jgi:hypothetical protein
MKRESPTRKLLVGLSFFSVATPFNPLYNFLAKDLKPQGEKFHVWIIDQKDRGQQEREGIKENEALDPADQRAGTSSPSFDR